MGPRQRELLESLRGGLVVSCQARVGWPMHGSSVMAAFAVAAEEGGARGIRANGPEDVAAVVRRVSLPVIGLNKRFMLDGSAFITPTFASAKEVLDAGAAAVAIDATPRERPGGEHLADIVARIRSAYPDALVMGEISTLGEAVAADSMGFDLISTTLAGYTPESERTEGPDAGLVRAVAERCATPVVAEGRVRDPADAATLLDAGAAFVVVGTSITRPEVITGRFVEALEARKENAHG